MSNKTQVAATLIVLAIGALWVVSLISSKPQSLRDYYGVPSAIALAQSDYEAWKPYLTMSASMRENQPKTAWRHNRWDSPAMHKLCNKDAGVHFYHKATDVEGYAETYDDGSTSLTSIKAGAVSNSPLLGGCFPCIRKLLTEGYRYYETYYVSHADRENPDSSHNIRDYDVTQTGLYRYKLVNRADNPALCIPYDKIVKEAERLGEFLHSPYSDVFLRVFDQERTEFKNNMEGKCVYAEPIKEFGAPYVMRLTREKIKVPEEIQPLLRIERQRTSIESKDGKMLIEAISYAEVIGHDMVTPTARGSVVRQRCGGSQLPNINEILVPLK